MERKQHNSSKVRLAEIMAALSLATDLGMGQPLGFALNACVLAVRLGAALKMDESALHDVYYYALLRYSGCTAETHVFAALFGDEIELRRDVATIDMGNPAELLPLLFHYVAQANAGAPRLQVARLVTQGMITALRDSGKEFAGHCEVAQRLATRLNMSEGVIRALGQLYERWDGKGMPNGIKGEALESAVRVVVFAQDMVIFHRLGGVDSAKSVAHNRTGTAYDPYIVECFLPQADTLLSGLEQDVSWEMVLAAEPNGQTCLDSHQFDTACQAVADFADLKSPYTLSHSHRVAELAAAAAQHIGLPSTDIDMIRRAGWMHEIGRVGISTAVWVKQGQLTDHEREQVRLHPYYTERVLARPGVLSQIGTLAAMHHERMDGSGYHKGAGAATLSPAARVLAAANTYQAMLEPRPHRPACTPDAAASTLHYESHSGHLDSEAVSAVLTAAGHHVRPSRRDGVAGLSERELEVLRLMARGHTMKQIADQLVISKKTVDNHIQHIYEKIGVSSRAGATLFAVEQNLLLDA